MAAYLIANVDIKDAGKFKDYMKATPPVIKQFGGIGSIGEKYAAHK